MPDPIIVTADLESRFQALKNRPVGNQSVPFTPDYKNIPSQNYPLTQSVSTSLGSSGLTKFAANTGTIYGQPMFFSPVHTNINWQIPQKKLEVFQC